MVQMYEKSQVRRLNALLVVKEKAVCVTWDILVSVRQNFLPINLAAI